MYMRNRVETVLGISKYDEIFCSHTSSSGEEGEPSHAAYSLLANQWKQFKLGGYFSSSSAFSFF